MTDSATARPLRILLVEDEEMDYLVVRALLAQHGDRFQLDWRRSYGEGLDALAKGSYDACLLDYLLDDGDGIQLLEEAREKGIRVPAILLTARGLPEIDQRAMKAGAADYLIKGQVDGGSLERSLRYAVERARAVERLRQSESFLQSTLDALSSRIAILDVDGQIVAVNGAWSKLRETWRSAGDYGVGASYLAALESFEGDATDPSADAQAVAAGIRSVIDGDIAEFSRECMLQGGATGSEGWVNVRVTRFGAGGPCRVVVAHEDITERKHTERALFEREEQLRHSQKMGAVGRLAGGVAHDFNNILTMIRGHAELLVGRVDAGTDEFREAEEIRKAAERAALLTDRLLAFGRRQVLQPRVLDLNATIVDIAGVLERLIGEDVELTTALSVEPAHVYADAGQLEQVLLNLAINARDAMPRGGAFRIETAVVDLAEDATKTGPGRYVRLRVCDDGVGMDADTRSHLFEPFFTTKGQADGSGLGLATVYGIVTQSGGAIDVESTSGQGASFVIHLPWQEVEAKVSAPQPERTTVVTTETETKADERVLLVEDEDGVRALVREVLELSGYAVLEACDGMEAIRICDSQPAGHIDLLITDVVMPEMSGRELTDRLLPIRPEIKVLYVSGYTEDAVLREGVQARQVAFLQKPFSIAELSGTVRSVLDGTYAYGTPDGAKETPDVQAEATTEAAELATV